MSGLDAAAELLPGEMRSALRSLPPALLSEAQEIRLRLGRRPALTVGETEQELTRCEIVARQDLCHVLDRATGSSPYIAQESLRHGYVNAGNGVRVGLCGRMRPGAEGTWAQGNLTSVCIRIPREVRGCAEPFCSVPFVSTLILSPPGAGKTTLLRDMVRLLSDRGERVGLCDERGEVAGLTGGSCCFDVGRCTDVLSEAPKGRGAMQLLRTMTPRILVMDEISAPEDLSACRAAAGCGAAILATAHAGEGEEWERKPLFRSLREDRIFHRLIRIRVGSGGREYREESWD